MFGSLFYKSPPPYPDGAARENFTIRSMECHFNDFEMLTQNFVDNVLNNSIAFNEKEEGGVLEKQVSTVLVSLFKENVYRGPQIVDKGKRRELTDIFTFSELGIFLFETKALGIANVGIDRTMERKVFGIQKQVRKAIDQLVGAVKRLRSNAEVFDQNNKIISYSIHNMPHCIILVSELLPFGNWREILMLMFKEMTENSIILHLMDLTEFMRFVGIAQNNTFRFDDLLMQRADAVLKNENLFIEFDVVPE